MLTFFFNYLLNIINKIIKLFVLKIKDIMQSSNATIIINLSTQENFYNCYESEGFVKFQYTVSKIDAIK